MSDLEELEHKIRNLPIEDLSKFRAWFIEFDHLLWDKQIEADSKAGSWMGSFRKPSRIEGRSRVGPAQRIDSGT